MVRLPSPSFLHLVPEAVEGDFSHPFYAKVMSIDHGAVTFRSLEGGEGYLPRSAAAEFVVTANEVSEAGQLSFLRRPVSAQVAEQVHFGQIMAVGGNQLTIICAGDEIMAAMDFMSLVPPIVAFLLQQVQCHLEEWTAGGIQDVETAILDRALGRNGHAGSKSLTVVLEGLMAEECYPTPTQMCGWIDPGTDDEVQFPPQHALDFAYYVDGRRDLVPASIGPPFCRPPRQQQQPEQVEQEVHVSEREQVELLFDLLVDDDEDGLDQQVCGGPATGEDNVQSATGKRSRVVTSSTTHNPQLPNRDEKRRRTALDQDAMIIEKLS
ncbi:hypothetical protein PHYSODRAFT_322033 [Phytophthora sojae]|uniref:Uncharacterized protein n=1 Tax=Phytophthora sojae (strain P6497) TaxID=1094619 RepID=G4YG19_PHYSP|nr:hypothetical protein PHYSODRAFT_322033 [Phytophthora sojae]EGZ28362.1 hypothetical protein PHYSODRAFT_322033 [Phytophthora sojae]|eukprot:XP_009515637.1 hypothetical protein PHYSODRAFT_322033 [Phytophthora sojae]